MQELKDKIQHAIEELNSELSEYQAGYKQCLINIQNDIDFQMLQMEEEQLILFGAQCMIEVEKESGLGSIRIYELYYNKTFNKSIKDKG